MKGLIIKTISGEYSVKLENGEVVVCKPLGIFRHKKINPKIGDVVIVKDNVIIDIIKRKNELIRPNCANVDKVFIVTSVLEPSLNLNLLDRIICQVEYCNIESVLIFTKLDLVKENDLGSYYKIFDYYKSLGYKVYISSHDCDEIKKEIDNSICVVAGQSGVGKSTLINLFDNFNIKTDAISKALGRGKHTTRCSELLSVGSGYIADTPGFGTLDLEMDIVSLSQSFREFFQTKCRFNPCTHQNEPNCEVKNKVLNNEILKSRYDNYKLFVNEIINKKKY